MIKQKLLFQELSKTFQNHSSVLKTSRSLPSMISLNSRNLKSLPKYSTYHNRSYATTINNSNENYPSNASVPNRLISNTKEKSNDRKEKVSVRAEKDQRRTSNGKKKGESKVVKFRRYFNRPSPPKIPKPHHGIETVESFLDSLRRPNLLDLKDKVEGWDELFKLDGKSLGLLNVINLTRDRRYLLRSLELFRQGLDPKKFSVGVRKPKKIRGWGPRVQNGIRLRGKPGGKLTI